MTQAANLRAVAKIARLVLIHLNAGHDERSPKLVADMVTLRTDLNRVLDAISAPLPDDEVLRFLVRRSIAIEGRIEDTVSIAEDIQAAAEAIGRDAEAAAERVNQAIADLRADLQEAKDELAALIAAGEGDQDALQAALDAVNAADQKVDSIEPSTDEPPADGPEPEQPTP